MTSFLSLFTSFSTLVCCALPALFVVVGFGAAFAGLVAAVPELIWISEHKLWFFGFGAVMILIGGILQFMNRSVSCRIDELGAACVTTRDWSVWVYWVSVGLYGVGVFFSFIAPRLLS